MKLIATALTNPDAVEEMNRIEAPPTRTYRFQGDDLVQVTPTLLLHTRSQHRVWKVLTALFPDDEVLMGFPFEVGTRDYRAADVGVVSGDRVRAAGDRVLEGAPDLVVEVELYSTTVGGLKRYRDLCFSNGSKLFWAVDPYNLMIEAHTRGDKSYNVYGPGEHIPIVLFDVNTTLSVDQIFHEMTVQEE